MTFSTTENRVSTAGDGVVTAFSFPYLFFADDDLVVTLTVDATGVETVQTITTHYTVAGAGVAAGGTVTMVAAPASGETLLITRTEQFTQGLDLVENDPLPSDLVEKQFDILTMLAQQMNTQVERSVRFVESYSGSVDPRMPAPVAGAFLVWNTAADGITTSTDTAAQWLGGDGTELLPYYSFSADPNSGMWRIGADNVGFSVNGSKVLDLATTGLTITGIMTASGVVTGSTVEATGDTSAGDNSAMGYTAAEGLILTGQGSTNDITLKNDADAEVMGVPTGTTGATFKGVIRTDDTTDATSGTTGSIQTDGGLGVAKDIWGGATIHAAGDTAAGDNAAMGYTAAEGLILTGQGSTNDITLKNDADGDVLVVPTGTTNVDIAGVATALTFEPDGDTTAGDGAAIGYTASEGLILTGQGSSTDVTIKNDADQTVASIATGTKALALTGDLTIAGDLTVNGTTVTLAVTNQVSADPLIELNNGAASNANDLGVIMERGSTGDNAFMGWDESGDHFVVATTAATGSSTGNISYTLADFQAGIITGTTFDATGDTSAGDNSSLGYTAAEGAILTGQGSTNDVTIKNDADAAVIEIPTGTTNVDIVGVATASTFEPDGDTTAGDAAAIGYTASEGLILTGQGSANDVTIKNDADAVALQIATGTTVVDLPAGGLKLATGATVTAILDEDDMSSDDATGLTTQQAAKAYIDAAVKAPGIQMTWEANTNDADQGAAKVWANHATLSSATVLYFDDVENNSVSINALIDSLDDPTASNSATIYIQEAGNGSAGVVFQVSGAVTSASTYSKVAVTHVATIGTLTDGDTIGVIFAFAGDDGAGGTVSSIAAGAGFSFATITTTGTIAVDGVLQDIDTAGTNSADGDFLVGTGAGAVTWESAATALASIGALASGDTSIGKHSLWVPVAAMRPTTSNGCSAVTDFETTAGRPDFQVMYFDGATDEHAQFSIALPKSWNESTVTFQAVSGVTDTAATDGTDTVSWGLQAISLVDDASLDQAYGTGVVVTETTAATVEDVSISAESAAITIASVAANAVTMFRAYRDVSADDMTEDAGLIGYILHITTDAGTDA